MTKHTYYECNNSSTEYNCVLQTAYNNEEGSWN